MSIVDEYRHAISLVEEVERGPLSKFSAETRSFAALVHAVDNYHRETQRRADNLQEELTRYRGLVVSCRLRIHELETKNSKLLDEIDELEARLFR